MKKTNLEVIQIIAKVLGILSRIAFIFSIIGIVGCVIGVVTLTTIRLSSADLTATIENESSRTVVSIIGGCLVGLVACIEAFIGSKMARDYFLKEQEVGTPFTVEGAMAFRTLGVYNIAAPVISAIVIAIVAGIFKATESVDYDVNLGLGIAMVLLSYVFAYGAELESPKEKIE